MKVTQESDYAIRICCVLDETDGMLDAESIAGKVAISKAIALKVLRKLKAKGIVDSQQGAVGGYMLVSNPEKLTVCKIIEAIEGEVSISKCLSDDHPCSRNGTNKMGCKMHIAFAAINEALTDMLKSVTVRSITDPEVSSLDIIENLK
ncbi:MAG: Rrf2 family transcriptional regulator [Ruminococcaceae bacterium]|nr:Rrf2 family transcriptional regulator [Oscillospiraceae bacterium]